MKITIINYDEKSSFLNFNYPQKKKMHISEKSNLKIREIFAIFTALNMKKSYLFR